MKTKLFALFALLSFGATLTSCGDNEKSDTYEIGVLLPVEHVALQTCADGFKEGLIESGLVENKDFSIKVMNAGGNSADLTAYAKQLVSESNMTFGLGTDSAKQLKAATIDKGLLNPVLFSAVTDPVGAELVKSFENGTGICTGTSDAQPIEEQIKLIKECLPEADKIGIIYTQSESNSKVQADQAEAAAISAGLEVEIQTVTGAADINSTALALASVSGMDAIYLPTDNNIASHMNDIMQAANSKHVLLVAGEEGMLVNGAHITLSIDYKELGKVTGRQAASIIKDGKKAYEIPVVKMNKEDCEYVFSSKNIAGAGISLPQEIVEKCRDISK